MHIPNPRHSVAACLAAFAVCCVVFGGTTSACSGERGDDVDTATYTALSDTLSQLVGEVYGYQYRTEIDAYRQMTDSTYDINAFADGLGVTLNRRHPMAFVSGVSMGVQMTVDLDKFAELGAKIDRPRLLERIERVVMQHDSLSAEQNDNLVDPYINLSRRIEKDGVKLTAATADSLQTTYADYVGALIVSDVYNFRKAEGRDFDVAQFLKGLASVVDEPHSSEYIYGAYQAMMLSQQIAVIETKGINIRPQTVLENIRLMLSAPTVDKAKALEAQTNMRRILSEAENRLYEAEDAEMAASDKAVQNVKTGEALVAKMKKETPEARTTASGLTYVIHHPGDGTKINDTDTVCMKITASHLDNKTFYTDGSTVDVPAGMLAGLKEGVLMLGNGAKASFWIPGALAYRGHGSPALGVEPMETIVVDVEILDVIPAQNDVPASPNTVNAQPRL